MFQGSGEIVVDIRLKRKDRTYRPNVSHWCLRAAFAKKAQGLLENAGVKVSPNAAVRAILRLARFPSSQRTRLYHPLRTSFLAECC